jgi:hypothetical protein
MGYVDMSGADSERLNRPRLQSNGMTRTKSPIVIRQATTAELPPRCGIRVARKAVL